MSMVLESREALDMCDPYDYSKVRKTPTQRLLEGNPWLLYKLTQLSGLSGFQVPPSQNNEGLSPQQREGRVEALGRHMLLSCVTEKVSEQLDEHMLSDDQRERYRLLQAGFPLTGEDFSDNERETVARGAESDEFFALALEYLPEAHTVRSNHAAAQHANRLALLNQHVDL